MFGSSFIPPQCFHTIIVDTNASPISITQRHLRALVPYCYSSLTGTRTLRCESVEEKRLCLVGGYNGLVACGVEEGEDGLGRGVSCERGVARVELECAGGVEREGGWRKLIMCAKRKAQ